MMDGFASFWQDASCNSLLEVKHLVREGAFVLHHAGSFPLGAIAPVRAMMIREEREVGTEVADAESAWCLCVWIPAAAQREATAALTKYVNECGGGLSLDALGGSLGRLALRGRTCRDVLRRALHVMLPEASDGPGVWSFEVEDPRQRWSSSPAWHDIEADGHNASPDVARVEPAMVSTLLREAGLRGVAAREAEQAFELGKPEDDAKEESPEEMEAHAHRAGFSWFLAWAGRGMPDGYRW